MRINTKTSTTTQSIFKPQKTKDKEKNLKEARVGGKKPILPI